VDPSSGSLTSNGTLPTPNNNIWGQVDPSGKFLFTTNVDFTVSEYIISSSGMLVPNGSVSLGNNMQGITLAFAQPNHSRGRFRARGHGEKSWRIAYLSPQLSPGGDLVFILPALNFLADLASQSVRPVERAIAAQARR
jgi:hypothetical protein